MHRTYLWTYYYFIIFTVYKLYMNIYFCPWYMCTFFCLNYWTRLFVSPISIDYYSIYILVSAVITLVDNQLNNLRELMLDGADLTDKSIHHIARCAKLNKLQISFCEGLTDRALKYIQVTRDHDCQCQVIMGILVYIPRYIQVITNHDSGTYR